MTIFIKPQSNNMSLSSANNVFSAQCVRIVNNTAGLVLITHAYANSVQIGTFVMLPNSEVHVVKTSTDLISANATVQASSVGFY